MTRPTTWIDHAVTGVPACVPGAFAILLDPRGSIPRGAIPGWEWHLVESRWEVRQFYEQRVRDRADDASPTLLHVTDPSVHRPDQLPWDLSHLSIAKVDSGLSSQVLEALPDLPDEVLTDVCSRARRGQGVGQVIAARMLGATVPAPDASAELLLAARAHAAGLSGVIRSLLAEEIDSPLARDAIGHPTPDGLLAAAWRDWCDRGASSAYDAVLSGCGPSLLTFVETGLLTPPETLPPGVPAWLAVAGSIADPTPAVHELLATAPAEPPKDFPGWAEVATWWARVRWACATGNVDPGVVGEAWRSWGELDRAFLPWLMANYASELGRSYLPPRTVDKIAPFLARQLRRRERPQVLAVMDGMGIAQWTHLRAAAGAVEAERHLVMAAPPTVTQVSRQAIFAGRPPSGFATTVQSPAEERLWRAFWASEGLNAAQVHYLATNGRDLPSLPDTARAVGLVVNTVDEAMHSAGVFGDVGFRDLVSRFAGAGFVQRLLALAQVRGWDLWFTADHGNLACRGLADRIPRQGLRVSSRGKRVWTFQSSELRASADVAGIPWDPPGYPQEVGYPLFAVGRSCYERDAVMVSHGGLSFDEVFVPLVRVET